MIPGHGFPTEFLPNNAGGSISARTVRRRTQKVVRHQQESAGESNSGREDSIEEAMFTLRPCLHSGQDVHINLANQGASLSCASGP